MIIGVNINRSARLVKVFYDTETVRVYRGRVPFTVLDFINSRWVWCVDSVSGWDIYRENSFDDFMGGVENA